MNEEVKNKKNVILLLVMIIVLLVVIIGLLSYKLYLSNDKSNNYANENKNQEVENKQENENKDVIEENNQNNKLVISEDALKKEDTSNYKNKIVIKIYKDSNDYYYCYDEPCNGKKLIKEVNIKTKNKHTSEVYNDIDELNYLENYILYHDDNKVKLYYINEDESYVINIDYDEEANYGLILDNNKSLYALAFVKRSVNNKKISWSRGVYLLRNNKVINNGLKVINSSDDLYSYSDVDDFIIFKEDKKVKIYDVQNDSNTIINIDSSYDSYEVVANDNGIIGVIYNSSEKDSGIYKTTGYLSLETNKILYKNKYNELNTVDGILFGLSYSSNKTKVNIIILNNKKEQEIKKITLDYNEKYGVDAKKEVLNYCQSNRNEC